MVRPGTMPDRRHLKDVVLMYRRKEERLLMLGWLYLALSGDAAHG